MHMRLIEKMSITEIALALGKNNDYVKTNQKRGVQSLRNMLACTPPGTKNIVSSSGSTESEVKEN
jgi:hypothetical protein